MSDEALRLSLIDCVCKLPAQQLPELQHFLDKMQSAPPCETDTSHINPSFDNPPAIDWPHAPMHRVSPSGTYLVTAGTYLKKHFFDSTKKLDFLHDSLLSLAKACEWRLEAWAVFSTHYHFVGHAPNSADALPLFAKKLHHATAKWVNEMDNAPGRKVWHNYWETALTYEKSYFARLNYVHQNPVRHGIVVVAYQYRWCSAAWFERTATVAQVKTIYRFKTNQLKVLDDYEALAPTR